VRHARLARIARALPGRPHHVDRPALGARFRATAFEFVRDRRTKQTFDPTIGFGLKVQQAAFESGVAIYPGAGTVDGLRGDHVLLAPPYTVSEEQIETIVKAVRRAVESQEKLYLD
jgi:adenosylmethionine-8-amino-7-oxononanoate aminotransferase